MDKFEIIEQLPSSEVFNQLVNTKMSKGTFVGLVAAKGSEGFFKKYGFIERPNFEFGAAMYKYI